MAICGLISSSKTQPPCAAPQVDGNIMEVDSRSLKKWPDVFVFFHQRKKQWRNNGIFQSTGVFYRKPNLCVFFPINGFSTGQTNRNCLVGTGTMEFYDFSIMLGII
jgi:hypothetical protein